MNRMWIRIVVSVFVFLCASDVYAQRIVTRGGSYTFPVPENVSIDEAKLMALEKARIQVIADEFGTIVDMTTMTEVRGSEDASSVEMISYGESEVKGEWLEDVDEPEFKVDYDGGILSVTVTVKGKIREIVSAEIDFEAKVLRNGTEDRFEDHDFKHGDDLYLSFRSPVDGSLAVYLYDGQGEAFCLLPYVGQEEGCFNIRRNERYVLFSSKNTPEEVPSHIVDEYNLTASKDKEVNLIYVIFSPNKFTKALDELGDELLPRSLDYKSFQKWLVKCRNRDKEMRVQRKTIIISRN